MPISGPRPTHLPATQTTLGSKLVGGLTQPMPNRISLKDDRFTLILESGQLHPQVPPSLQLQVIMVGGNEHVSRVYYAADDAYDAENPNAPTCWSDNGVGPSDKVPTPVSPTCAQCPNSVWGSKITAMGSKVPACAHRKKIAVLVAGAGGTVFLLDVPPASLKSFGKYMARLGGELHTDPCDVVTTLKMENKTLVFEDSMWLPQDLTAQIHAIVESGEGDRICGSEDRPHQMRLAGPTRAEIARVMGPEVSTVAQEPIPETFAPQPEAFQQPMTSHQAEAFHTPSAQAQVMEQFATGRFDKVMAPQEPPKERKPRAKKETVVGPGPIPAKTFGMNPSPNLNPAASFGGQQTFDERSPPPAGGSFMQGQPQQAPQFGMQAAPAAPPQDMADMLSKAFGLRIGK